MLDKLVLGITSFYRIWISGDGLLACIEITILMLVVYKSGYTPWELRVIQIERENEKSKKMDKIA